MANQRFLILDSNGRHKVQNVDLSAATGGLAAPASESLVAGAMVRIIDVGGVAKVSNAEATAAGKEAIGYVKATAVANDSVTVYFNGINDALTGLTPGTRYYLSATPGAISASYTNTSGYVCQYVGTAISATSLVFEADEGVVL